ncbi:YhcN/YlaJ family sporulation lipoprotein [Halobacillus salinus]|uniref:YhcN/YlaJ family sporulation lipoprotein n=1 Tax=Halobacillus salinus TaxID=192814 RepID=A0A4Z0H6S9_9BACI|nr:YhcN/YlaJ family sporulation lipoprotein [Halobacillus salinus]TGB05051.1 YhcN/YlaJ family sporulation lipoprotein [Halobacillus salinus]
MKRILLITLLLFLAACQANNEQSLLRERQTDPELKYVTDSDPVERKELTNQQIAKRLAQTAVEVPDVRDARAIVLGNYVAVGIDVDKDLDRSRVGVIKFSVAEALKHDPYGKQAVVIADADGLERIKGLTRKMKEGHPIQAVTEELSQIVGRYMPEGPINERSQSESNQQSVNQKDQEKLKKIEKEQSKEQGQKNS